MNLLHLADLHLGKRVNGFDLLPDQRYILEQVLDLCTAHNVQAVALAGDIYDTALPLPPRFCCWTGFDRACSSEHPGAGHCRQP